MSGLVSLGLTGYLGLAGMAGKVNGSEPYQPPKTTMKTVCGKVVEAKRSEISFRNNYESNNGISEIRYPVMFITIEGEGSRPKRYLHVGSGFDGFNPTLSLELRVKESDKRITPFGTVETDNHSYPESVLMKIIEIDGISESLKEVTKCPRPK